MATVPEFAVFTRPIPTPVREFSGIICFSLFKLHPLSVNLRHSGTIIYFEHMCFVHIIAVFHQILIAK